MMAPGQATARHINPRAVYDQLLSHEALTRDELCDLTGLTRVAASASVDNLIERGLALTTTPRGGHGGPAAKRYALTPTAGFVVGTDIRHGNVTVAAADLTGDIVARLELPFEDPDDAASVLYKAVTGCLREAGADLRRLRRVVLGSPGVIDPSTGEFAFANVLPTWKTNVTNELRERLGRPVVFENDVNLAAMAEARFGRGAGVPHLVFAWFGGGLGFGLVLNGRLHRGRKGWAGEVGYLPAPPPQPYIEVGDMPSSLHQLASGVAIGAFAKASGLGEDPSVAVTTALARGEEGEPFLRTVARRVAMVTTVATVLVDPSVLVVDGGYVTAGGERLLEMIREEAARLSPAPAPVVLASVHDDPILRGALQTALDDARDALFAS